MRPAKIFQPSGALLLILLCSGFTQQAGAQHFTASFMEPYETEVLGNGLYAFRIGMRRSIFVVGDDGTMFAQASTGPVSAIREKREFWEAIYAAVRKEMQQGTFVEEVPDALLASSEFKTDFLDRLGPHGYEESEMRILLRRVGSYISMGR